VELTADRNYGVLSKTEVIHVGDTSRKKFGR
jgi:hypothetical protein